METELKIFFIIMKKFYIFQCTQYPYYPGSGSEKEKGKFNNVFNIPLEAGTTAEEYLNAYDHVLNKLKEFKPEFLLFSAGFDAHIDDPLAQLRLESEDFYKLPKEL
jgi:acetoin utilization deacetylase AcuC-like enzyme